MGGVFSVGGPGETLTGFTDRAADGAERLIVAVLWRYPTPVVPRRSAFEVVGDLLTEMVHLIRHTIGRPPTPQVPAWAPPEGWSGTWGGGDGTRAVLYHRERRRVKVLDEEHVVPADGRTLVLLVDTTATATSAAAAGAQRPPIREHMLTMVAQAAEVHEPPPLTGRGRQAWEQAHIDAHRARDARWRELLLADAVVRAFWEAPAGGGR